MRARPWNSIRLLALPLALTACDLATAPAGGPHTAPAPSGVRLSALASDSLQVLRFLPGAPPATRDTSFWAVKGKDRRLILRYAGVSEPGEDEAPKLLEFVVPGDALARYPDGRAVAKGDSVLIRVQVDTAGFVFHFEPSGLRFREDKPAELKLYFGAADPDLDEDGDRDADDEADAALLQVFQQELPGTPWLRLASVRDLDEDRVQAEIGGFTRFALATSRRER